MGYYTIKRKYVKDVYMAGSQGEIKNGLLGWLF